MNSKKVSIIIFLLLIVLIFTLMSVLTIPMIFGRRNHIIGFFGLFLILSTIPIVFYILLKKQLKLYMIIYYFVYFFITSILNLIISILYTQLLLYNNDEFIFNIFELFDVMTYIVLSIFFSFQLPIIILSIIINKICNNKASILT
ncbi:MAG: hypothetical protein FWD14_05355 [Treponema sp.]|nr:hypothetical protein [Treponema sp.]